MTHATSPKNTSSVTMQEDHSATQELLDAMGTTLSPELLVQALTHRSFAHEHPKVPSYERLEFLGDAVLELVVTETLFTAHPDMSEGQMAKIRAKAVSEKVLASIARDRLHVGPYILLGRGEFDSGGGSQGFHPLRHRRVTHRRDFPGAWHR